MKKIGCLLGIVGLIMFIGSFAMFGMIAVRATQANKVASVDMEVGTSAATDELTVSTDKACQVAVRIHVESTSIERGTGSNGGQKVQYEFPFSCKVLDPDGKVIHSQDDSIASGHGVKVNSSQRISSGHGTARAQCNFGKFDVAAPGKIRVEATVQPDTKYNAEAQSLTLEVYDNVSRHSGTVGSAVTLVLLGPLVGVLGIVIFIVGVARGKKAPAAPQSYDPGPPVEYEIKD